jgi:hypothetical protein
VIDQGETGDQNFASVDQWSGSRYEQYGLSLAQDATASTATIGQGGGLNSMRFTQNGNNNEPLSIKVLYQAPLPDAPAEIIAVRMSGKRII